MDETQSGTRAKARLLSSSDLLVGLGFGCYTSWVSMTFHSMGLFANGPHAEQLLDLVYLVSIVALIATLGASAVFHRQVGVLLSYGSTLIVLPVGVTGATLLMPLSSMDGPVGLAFAIGAGVVSGVFSGLQLLTFGAAFPRLGTRSLVTSVASGQILASAIFALSLVFPPFEACLFAASMPCAAALLLHFGMKDRAPGELNEVTPLSRQAVPDDQRALRTVRRLLVRLSACVMLVGFANESARTLYMQIEESIKRIELFSQTQAVIAVVVSAGVIAIALIAVRSKNHLMPRACYHLLGIGLMAGALLLPTVLVYPALDVRIPLTVNAASYTCFGMFSWLILASVCRLHSSLCVRSVAAVRAAWAVGPAIGMMAARLAMGAFGVTLEVVFPFAVLGAFAVFIAANAAFDGNMLLEALDLVPSERRQRFQEKCRAVIERYGLTEREGEVMTLFAKGRNLDYIKDELCLSKSTVSTHRQHIYQKLGVHSLQDMLDLIQDADAED